MYSTLLSSCFLLAALVRSTPVIRRPNACNVTNLNLIGLEEHYVPSAFSKLAPNPVNHLTRPQGESVLPGATNITGFRLDNMNSNGVRMVALAVANQAEAREQPDIVTEANNEIAQAIAPYPQRFRGMCYLPMAYPQLAAAELERCISELKFVGVLVDDHLANGSHFDGPQYDVLWEAVERHGVPFYLHPTPPLIQDITGPGGRYNPEGANFSVKAGALLSLTGFGWHVDDGIAFIRLWLAGVFDRFPKLKIVLGHMGETVPYYLPRIDQVLTGVKGGGRGVYDVWAENIWTTTSGPFDVRTFAAMKEFTSIDRIMFSGDFPFYNYDPPAAFMQQLRQSNLISQEDWQKVAFRNAEALLGLGPSNSSSC